MREWVNKSKHAGFTLLEAMISLVILGGICFLMSSLMSYTKQVQPVLWKNEEKQWHIFLIQFEKEFKKSEFNHLEATKVFCYNSEKNVTVIFEIKKNKVVKVENGGYQPLLMNLEFAEFSQEDEYLVLTVVFPNKRKFLGKWRMPIQYDKKTK